MTEKENRPTAGEAASEEFVGSRVKTTPVGAHTSTPDEPRFHPEHGSPAQLVNVVTARFLRDCRASSPASAEQGLLHLLNVEVAKANSVRRGTGAPRLQTYKELPRDAVVALMLRLFIVRKVRPPRATKGGVIAVYQSQGPDKGIYVGESGYLRSVVRQFLPSAGRREANEVLDILRDMPDGEVPVAHACEDQDLVPVNNGVFNYATKELLPFTPDVVFTAKLRTNYVEGAPSPQIEQPDGSMWDIETSVSKMFAYDEELISAWWHVVGASVRPNVSWDQAVYFFDEVGGSGKGTSLELMRGLHGDGSCAALSIADFADSRRFRIVELEGKTLNACDENAVGEFNDDLANFKAVITNDVVNFERKMEQSYTARVAVFMVQCLNGFTRSKDTSPSARRRQYYLPFPRSFTGAANPKVKSDYVRRPAVLEYVMHKVLNMPDFYHLPKTEAGEALANEAQVFNDSVVEFWEDFRDRFVWDLLPTEFLFDLYKAWFRAVNPNGRELRRLEFIKRVGRVAEEGGAWEYPKNPVRVGSRLDTPEPLIGEYGLENWMNAAYRGSGTRDQNKLCQPLLTQSRYRGLLRKKATSTP